MQRLLSFPSPIGTRCGPMGRAAPRDLEKNGAGAGNERAPPLDGLIGGVELSPPFGSGFAWQRPPGEKEANREGMAVLLLPALLAGALLLSVSPRGIQSSPRKTVTARLAAKWPATPLLLEARCVGAWGQDPALSVLERRGTPQVYP